MFMSLFYCCVHTCMWVHILMCTCAHGLQKQMLGQRSELQAFVILWALGSQLLSLDKSVSVPNHWAISLSLMFAFLPPLPDRALNFQREIWDFLSFLLKIFPYFPFSLVKRITWEYSASSIFWMIIYGPGIQGICSLCLVKTMARRGKQNVTQIFQPPRPSALFVHPCGHRLSAFCSCGTNLSGTRGRDTDVSGWGGPSLSREHWGSAKKGSGNSF